MALVLKRKINSRTFLEVPPSSTPTTIEIQVIQTSNSVCRLGIQAPPEVLIAREEIRIRRGELPKGGRREAA